MATLGLNLYRADYRAPSRAFAAPPPAVEPDSGADRRESAGGAAAEPAGARCEDDGRVVEAGLDDRFEAGLAVAGFALVGFEFAARVAVLGAGSSDDG